MSCHETELFKEHYQAYLEELAAEEDTAQEILDGASDANGLYPRCYVCEGYECLRCRCQCHDLADDPYFQELDS